MYHTRALSKICRINRRFFHVNSQLRNNEQGENPLSRTFNILLNDVKEIFLPQKEVVKRRAALGLDFPSHTDVLIVGGGAMGSATAYWLKEKSGEDGIKITVVEKDPSYAKSSTALSVGGLRQQFSLPENIQMSLFSAEFLRTIKHRFGPEADVSFVPHGYLVLAGEEGAEQLLANSALQRELGATNEILRKDEIKERFPWMDVTGVELGCLGLEKEGWFDPWSLLALLKVNAIKQGTEYIKAELVDFVFDDPTSIIIEGGSSGEHTSIKEAIVQMPDGTKRSINFAVCIIAAGAESAEIAKLARIGEGEGLLSVPLPVERRKRYVYSFACQGEPPGLNSPFVIDTSGCYFRRDGLGGAFLAGLSPLPEEEPPTDNLEVDYGFFDSHIWPNIARRVPAFNSIKVRSAWSGYYEYNSFDENGIIGQHPYYQNFFFATGFSGHGIQQAPAVGRAIAELILDGGFETIDLTRFGFDRLLIDKPMYEIGIY